MENGGKTAVGATEGEVRTHGSVDVVLSLVVSMLGLVAFHTRPSARFVISPAGVKT